MGHGGLVVGISNLEILPKFLQIQEHCFGFIVHWNIVRKLMDSMMLLTKKLSLSVGSIDVLVTTGVVLLLVTAEVR